MNNFDCISNQNGRCKEKNMSPCKGWKTCSLSDLKKPCKKCIFGIIKKDYDECKICKYSKIE